VAILGGRGERLAGRGFRRELSAEVVKAIREEALSHTADGHPFVPAHPAIAGRALAHPVISPGGGPPQAWVVIVRDSGGLGDFERLILQQAVAVVALELMRRRVARETERRLAGDVLAGALGGRLEPSELRRRLEPFGIGDEAAVLVFSLDDPAAAESVLERALAADACPAVVAPHASGRRELLCAVVDASDRDPVDLAADARKALTVDRGTVRAAASRPAPPEMLRHSFHEARCALEATAIDNGNAPEVASWKDLGAFTLLLSIQDDEALKLYCDSVLGPIEEGDEEYGGELLRSLEAFIEQNGQWERAAREVYCHRHTLRYRMRRVEELTGRDLSRAHDRIEFWLALRARELVT
jgi:purine catabolism regulator